MFIKIYKENIWPRGFALEKLNSPLPKKFRLLKVKCPIQQGLADKNPDVDAIYRLTSKLPISFNSSKNISLGNGSICPSIVKTLDGLKKLSFNVFTIFL